jgi:hypothetical protein
LSAVDELQTVMPKTRCGFAPWYERLSADDAATFAEIKRAFLAGELKATKNGVAAGVVVMLERRGINIKKLSVVRWLEA